MRAFCVLMCALGGVVAAILFHAGQGWVIPAALAAGALLMALERWEARRTAGDWPPWPPLDGFFLPVALIALAIFVVCLPTLNIYFICDDFAYLHHFQHFSLTQSLELFHTDIAKLLWGEPRQEIRPMYGLYFMISYQLWGLHPLGYHVVNILLQIINCSLVFLIAKELAPHPPWRAIMAAALFAVAPLQSDIFFWATGAPTELIPAFFYLAAFLGFMRFRARGSAAYLAISVLAFAGCLASKESAVTLPVMLISYEVFRQVTAENPPLAGGPVMGKRAWGRFMVVCLPYFALFLAYLQLRHWESGNYLRERDWGNLGEAVYSQAGLGHYLVRFVLHVWDVQAFHIRQLLIPYPAPILVLVLGLYIAWVYFLLARRSEFRPSFAPIVYFGLVWFAITSLPLVIVSLGTWHLYLPAVGPCIASSFLAFPADGWGRRRPGWIRLCGIVLLVYLSAFHLWMENTRWTRRGEMSARIAEGLRSALAQVPSQTIVLIWPGMGFPIVDAALPYSVEPPFTSSDLYAQAFVIPDVYLYTGARSEWYETARNGVDSESAGPPDVPVEIRLLSWDAGSGTVKCVTRIVTKRTLHDCAAKLPIVHLNQVNSKVETEANLFVQGLAQLVLDGSCAPASNP